MRRENASGQERRAKKGDVLGLRLAGNSLRRVAPPAS